MKKNMKKYHEKMVEFAYIERANRIAKEIELHFKYLDDDIVMEHIIKSATDEIEIPIKRFFYLLDDLIEILDKKYQLKVIKNDDGSFWITDTNQNRKTMF